MNEDSMAILKILLEKRVKPSDFIVKYRNNSQDIKKTMDFYGTSFNSKNNFFTSAQETHEPEIESLLKMLESSSADVINISQDTYPVLLKEIFFPPPILFYKGIKILQNNLCIAIVGTRKATAYGRDAAMYFANQLARLGITIVSGLASGIDYYAHKASVNEKGSSIAVLGCGIDVVYPTENKILYNELGERGCILTEFFPGTPPKKNNFPARNRIISGLCAGVLVIEAPEKSGALITCSFAADQDREVFAIPGSIFSRQSMGNHKLIKNGAKIAVSPDDILEEIAGFFSVVKSPEKFQIKKS